MDKDTSAAHSESRGDSPPSARVCRACGEEKPLEQFSTSRKCRYGRTHVCNMCRRGRKTIPPPPAGQKFCSKCKELFPATLDYFYKEKITKDGLRSQCKKCVDAQSRAYFKQNKERLLQDAKDREAQSGRMARWYADNTERRRAEWRTYYQTRMDHTKRRQYERFHYQQNRAIYTAKGHRRRALKLAAPGSFSKDDLERQFKSQGGRCWWCGKPLDGVYHADHRIALFVGGTNYPSNIVCSCGPCNQSKGAKLPHQWNGRLL